MMRQTAFIEVNIELIAEKLKKEMKSRFTPATDKAADALIKKMEKQWMAMFQQTRAEQKFRDKLAKIYSEGQNNKYIQYTIIGLVFDYD